MPAPSALPWRTGLSVIALLALGACDGGRRTDLPDGGDGAAAPSTSVDAIAGAGAQPTCAKAGPQSLRKLLGSIRLE